MIDETYRQAIMQSLRQIEEEEQVRIVYACESGSRAWGFPSANSDYDVRFLYVRPVEWYLSIDEGRDVIERPISDMLDVNGWDLKKALRLFRKSNPPLLEWLQSPIVYEENFTIAESIRALSPLTFSPRYCLYHYLHMAKGNYRDYLQGEWVRVKKYFYVLRPLLACGWIEQFGTMPPMQFDPLLEAQLSADSEVRRLVEALLVRKRSGVELNEEPRLDRINAYLEERIAHYEQSAGQLPNGECVSTERLNELFRAVLEEVWRR